MNAITEQLFLEKMNVMEKESIKACLYQDWYQQFIILRKEKPTIGEIGYSIDY